MKRPLRAILLMALCAHIGCQVPNPAYRRAESPPPDASDALMSDASSVKDVATDTQACVPWMDARFSGRMAVVPQALAPDDPGSRMAITFDHAALVEAGHSTALGNDIQIARWDGAAWTVMPFFVDEERGVNRVDTTLWTPVAGVGMAAIFLHVGGEGLGGATASPAPILSSIQSGQVVLTADGTQVLPIRPVDPTRSFALLMTRQNANTPSGALAAIAVDPDGTLALHRRVSEVAPPPITARYLVAEFSNGVRVQHGQSAQAQTEQQVPIMPVQDLDRAFVLWSKTVNSEDSNWGPNDPISVELVSTASLSLRSEQETIGHLIRWQVVTATDDLLVRRGRVPFSLIDAIDITVPPVQGAQAQILAGFTVLGNNAEVATRMLGAWWSLDGKLHLERGQGTLGDHVTEATWQVLTWRNQKVENGDVLMHEGEARKQIPLLNTFDPQRTLVWVTVQAAGGQSLGRSTFLGDDVIGTCSLTLSLGAEGLIAERDDSRGQCRAGWTAVEFPRSVSATAEKLVRVVDPCGP